MNSLELGGTKSLQLVVTAVLAVVCAVVIAKGGIVVGGALIFLPFLIGTLVFAFLRPGFVLLFILFMGFMISLLGRYVPGISFGLAIDGLVVLLFVVMVFHQKTTFNVAEMGNGVVILLLLWSLFSVLQLFNPLSGSTIAWFYANRALSFYQMFIVILGLQLRKEDLRGRWLFIAWLALSVFGTLWGLKQLVLGVSAVEQRWLMGGAASTHILFGKLRIFSFYSDAAQFGASQAHAALVCGLIGLHPAFLRRRWLLLALAGFFFYGMLISGTRGALAVLVFGGAAYLLLTKNIKVLVLGMMVGAGAFGFLKYTTIMQSNYHVNRLRTALDSDDPSLRVRREREVALAAYLEDKPFGGGIGSAGYWGRRFSPGTFLAEIGTDGHYTRIWMETGKIGVMFYIVVWLAILMYLGRRIWRAPLSLSRTAAISLFSGIVGIAVASYSNGHLTQQPTGIAIALSLIFIYRLTERGTGDVASSL